jgi:NAD(P)-dependent dehydrogenase (short-subunit alcohol dehydrogenase family)
MLLKLELRLLLMKCGVPVQDAVLAGQGGAGAYQMLVLGYNVVLNGRCEALLEETLASAKVNPGQGLCVAGDISNVYDVDFVFDSCVECFGRVDVLFQQHRHQGTNG